MTNPGNDKTALRRTLLERRRSITNVQTHQAGLDVLAKATDAHLLDVSTSLRRFNGKAHLRIDHQPCGDGQSHGKTQSHSTNQPHNANQSHGNSQTHGNSQCCSNTQSCNGVSSKPVVAAFVSIRGEIDTDPLLHTFSADGWQVIVPASMKHVLWRQWSPNDNASNRHRNNDLSADSESADAASLDVDLSNCDSLGSDSSGSDSSGSDSPGSNSSGSNSFGSNSSGADFHSSDSDSYTAHGNSKDTCNTCHSCCIAQARLILVPALATDASGTRLGRGGGWYDRALLHRSPDAYVVAVCWPWEQVDFALPREDHDIPVDAVLTPKGFTAFQHMRH